VREFSGTSTMRCYSKFIILEIIPVILQTQGVLLTALRGSMAGAFAVLLIGTCAVLMLYLGSGYWLAPGALAVAAFALAFRLV